MLDRRWVVNCQPSSSFFFITKTFLLAEGGGGYGGDDFCEPTSVMRVGLEWGDR